MKFRNYEHGECFDHFKYVTILNISEVSTRLEVSEGRYRQSVCTDVPFVFLSRIDGAHIHSIFASIRVAFKWYVFGVPSSSLSRMFRDQRKLQMSSGPLPAELVSNKKASSYHDKHVHYETIENVSKVAGEADIMFINVFT